MNHYIQHRPPSDSQSPPPDHPASAAPSDEASESSPSIAVGDVVVRKVESGYGIFNYRGERVLEQPMRTAGEAERLAAEIVSIWQGRVRNECEIR